MKYEEILLKQLDQDKLIKNKDLVKTRINKRIEIIKKELTLEIKDEEQNISSNSEINPKLEPKVEIKQDQLNTQDNILKKVNPASEKLYKEIGEKLEDYKAAITYFMKIESMKQADDAREKAKILNQALEKLEKGEKVDEFSLPIAVTAEYICNMSKQDRLNNFSIIIKDYSARKNELNQKMQKALEGFKTLDKKTFIKNVSQILNLSCRKIQLQKLWMK